MAPDDLRAHLHPFKEICTVYKARLSHLNQRVGGVAKRKKLALADLWKGFLGRYQGTSKTEGRVVAMIIWAGLNLDESCAIRRGGA